MPLIISPRLDQPTLPQGQLLYAVGDIHGRLDLLESLLGLIEHDVASRQADQRTLVFVGDYIDRGPDSRGVVERLISDRADDPAPFAVGILDLDGFKPINDLFGRSAGDEILQQAAMRLRAAMDAHSTVARVGPDEFAFLYPMVFSEDGVADRARMLIEVLSAPYDPEWEPEDREYKQKANELLAKLTK